MPFEYKKLRGRIVEVFGTNKAFAEKLKISENALSKKLNGKTGLSQQDIILWSDLLGVAPVDYGAFYFE